MATPSDHVLLRPFYDVVKWAKYALFQDKDDLGHGDKLTSLNQSSQLLLREGERALRRLTPLLAMPSRQLTDFLKDLTLHNGKKQKARSAFKLHGALTGEQKMLFVKFDQLVYYCMISRISSRHRPLTRPSLTNFKLQQRNWPLPS
jgi:hypothetical protein